MMRGIPGTGTRNQGRSGPLLKTNLDGIINLRFHVLCLKVSWVSTVLCMGMLLPLNLTATCNPETIATSMCEEVNSLTDFERTTLAHIPSIEPQTIKANQRYPELSGEFIEIVRRLYAIVVVAWILSFYTCHLLWREWIDNLA